MGLAYTNLPVTSTLITATPPLTFLSALNSLLVAVGWTRLGNYDNGSYYQIDSPQGLRARVRIWYVNTPTSPNCFVLQCYSHADPLTVGLEHRFVAGKTEAFPGDGSAFTTYRVWANCCQLFIGAAHPFSWLETWPRAVECGVPHSYQATTPTPLCTRETPASSMTNELWFSAGDDNGQTFDVLGMTGEARVNFRNSFFCQRYTLVHNGNVLFAGDTGNPTVPVEANAFQLDILRSNFNWPGTYGYFSNGFTRPDGSPLAYNPMLSYQGYIFGELWDACLLSVPMGIDTTEDIFESQRGITTRWINYARSHGVQVGTFESRDEGRCYSLLLLTGPPEQTDLSRMNIAF